jgi:hypothetical protein
MRVEEGNSHAVGGPRTNARTGSEYERGGITIDTGQRSSLLKKASEAQLQAVSWEEGRLELELAKDPF